MCFSLGNKLLNEKQCLFYHVLSFICLHQWKSGKHEKHCISNRDNTDFHNTIIYLKWFILCWKCRNKNRIRKGAIRTGNVSSWRVMEKIFMTTSSLNVNIGLPVYSRVAFILEYLQLQRNNAWKRVKQTLLCGCV